MLALAGIPLGLSFRFLDPSPDAPAGAVGELLVGAYDDPALLDRLARRRRGRHLRVRERAGRGGSARRVRSRRRRRSRSRRTGWSRSSSSAGSGFRPCRIDDEVETFPAILKTRRLGYDGKGQRLVETRPGTVPGARPRGTSSLSTASCRSSPCAAGTARRPSTRSSRTCTRTASCAARARRRRTRRRREAEEYATRLLDELGYVGVLALELFDAGDRLLANELAPRVHNTGHWTIEGAATSQFENHLRAILGLPLGPTTLRGEVAMLNVIGTEPDVAAVLAVPGAHLHLYGKEPRPGRKLGHVTLARSERRAGRSATDQLWANAVSRRGRRCGSRRRGRSSCAASTRGRAS